MPSDLEEAAETVFLGGRNIHIEQEVIQRIPKSQY
jgi:hypothetical protein